MILKTSIPETEQTPRNQNHGQPDSGASPGQGAAANATKPRQPRAAQGWFPFIDDAPSDPDLDDRSKARKSCHSTATPNEGHSRNLRGFDDPDAPVGNAPFSPITQPYKGICAAKKPSGPLSLEEKNKEAFFRGDGAFGETLRRIFCQKSARSKPRPPAGPPATASSPPYLEEHENIPTVPQSNSAFNQHPSGGSHE